MQLNCVWDVIKNSGSAATTVASQNKVIMTSSGDVAVGSVDAQVVHDHARAALHRHGRDVGEWAGLDGHEGQFRAEGQLEGEGVERVAVDVQLLQTAQVSCVHFQVFWYL